MFNQLYALVWVLLGRWKEQPGRLALSTFAIALGVAHGLAIQLVNSSALSEFADAIALVNGQAQRQVVAVTGEFSDEVFADIARLSGFSASSPVLELNASLIETESTVERKGKEQDSQEQGGQELKLKIIGHDLFRAGYITPELVIVSDLAQINTNDNLSGFNADQIFVSTAVLNAAKKKVGDSISLRRGGINANFFIAGRLSQVPAGQLLATTDIASLQWRFKSTQLSRIDLKFDESADRSQAEAALQNLLNTKNAQASTTQLKIETPQASTQRMSNVSRAYRVNLAVLGLVALLVGGFLVFATMSLMAQRQLQDAAILKLLGLSPKRLRGFVLAQGVALGIVGSSLGIAVGVTLALGFLKLLGGDLGGGYFNGSSPALRIEVWDVIGFFSLGLLISLMATVPSMIQLNRRTENPIALLQTGLVDKPTEFSSRQSLRPIGIFALCLLLAVGLLQLPAIFALPLGGFAAMAVVLIAGIAVVPLLTQTISTLAVRVTTFSSNHPFSISLWLAAQRLNRYPSTVSTALSAIVASVALASAMAIMVHSFRDSVDTWLGNILPADIYVRSSAQLSERDQAELRKISGIARAEFLRSSEIQMRSDLPKVALIGRSFSNKPINELLPLVGKAETNKNPNILTVYASEAMVDLYGWQQSNVVPSPILSNGKSSQWFIAGIWRDYGRQHGAIVMALEDYASVTGNSSASDIAIWRAPNVKTEELIDSVKTYPGLEQSQARSSEAIRALSLQIFDRSFALTYVIEAIAILVALFGVASTYAGESLTRYKEFGVLAHIGAKRSVIAIQMAWEAFIGIALAVNWGVVIGIVLSWILVRRINPQSFHWSMDFSWPVGLLITCAALLIALGIVTALWAYRQSLSISPALAIKS